jgi:hypothetical protein
MTVDDPPAEGPHLTVVADPPEVVPAPAFVEPEHTVEP